MRLIQFNIKPLCAALMAASLLSACGGGGSGAPAASTTSPTTSTQPGTTTPGGSDTGSTTGGGTTTPGGTTTATAPAPVPASASMTMSCVDGPNYQCSGGSIIRVDNGVALTSSGVQVYGRSTSDMATPNPSKTTAFGLALASGGLAEVRLAKDSTSVVSSPVLLLSSLGLSWDGKADRPPVIETFSTLQGRVQLNANGTVTFGALPASSDLAFYDYASKGAAGTQVNYANNVYFPRTGNPSRCPVEVVPCPTAETTGLRYQAGDWRVAGGSDLDISSVIRVHEDGDVHAGDGTPAANGSPTILPGGSGPGVPFPGSKGYRSFDNWSARHVNLAAWVTQDTVVLEEWAALGNEHNKNRRGLVAFGAVTDPAAVPTSGSATYSGIVYGWYARNGVEDPLVFHGTATMTVNFATRQVSVTFQNTATYDAANTALPLGLQASAAMGAAATSVANYWTGSVDTGTLRGGLSGRYFGPVIATGTSGTGPEEAGGAFSLSNSTTGATVVGGFIGRKR